MKKIIAYFSIALAFILTLGCPSETTLALNVYNLSGINSIYDDYNSTGPPSYSSQLDILYSTNIGTAGKSFDIWEAEISILDNRVTSNRRNAYKFNNPISNEFGPIFFLSPDYLDPNNEFYYDSIFSDSYLDNGNRYLYASDRTTDNLDTTNDLNIYIMDNTTSLLFGYNSEYDDAYPCYDYKRNDIYFCSNREDGVNFNIYKNGTLATEFNSTANDKCPYIMDDIMVFTSDREGGEGGFDLYYSKYEDGAWSSPQNFNTIRFDGKINTQKDEYRPSLYKPNGYNLSSYNKIMIFSSNRDGGEGGFDLYLAILPENF